MSYFQFPLVLLARVESDEFAHDVIAWTLAEKGRKLYEGYEDMMARAWRDECLECHVPDDFDPADEAHWWILTMNHNRLKNVRVNSMRATARRYRSARDFVEGYLFDVDGRDMEVRVRSDLIWKQLLGPMSTRSFRVLCGLYAAIGSHPYRRVSLNHLRYLSAGYKSEDAFRRAGSGDEEDLLTIDQLRYTRDKLLDTHWLYRYWDGRHNYYSHRLNNDELAEAVVGRKIARKKRQIAEKKAKLEHQHQLDALDAELSTLDAALDAGPSTGDGAFTPVPPYSRDRPG